FNCGDGLDQQFIQNNIQKSADSKIDYLNRTILVTGRGASKQDNQSIAQKKLWAVTEARKNCFTHAAIALGEIKISGETLLETGKLKSINTQVIIENYIRGIEGLEESTEIMSDGSVLATVKMVIQFDGNEGLNRLLFNEIFGIENTEDLNTQDIGETSKKPNEITGFVFDVTNIKIVPSLAPRIYTDNGMLIYGPESVSKKYAVEYGIVGYTKSLVSVESRIGSNPLLIKVSESKFDDRSSIVIDKAEYEKLKTADPDNKLLNSCRVAFLIK
ncbi:hypothetical protein ACFL7D_10230, partial [candidate division KSB1 bacterium]